MQSRQTNREEAINQKCVELIQLCSEGSQTGEQIADHHLQNLLEMIIKIYAQKVSATCYNWEKGPNTLMPISQENQLSQTEISIFADRLLQAAELEIFELQIWRSMGIGY